jgi:hypothetical protein
MTTTFRVLRLATALTLGSALAASAQTNSSNPEVGTGLNRGVSHAVPGAGATTRQGVYPNRMRTGQNRVPGQGTSGMSNGDSGTSGSGTTGSAGPGGGH